MSTKSIYQNKDISIPKNINLLIMAASISSMVTLLYISSHFSTWYILLFCFIAFGFVANTTFALLHEAVHSVFHTNKLINNIAGNILAAFFPTAFSFQKHCHLNHHRQNRTDFEMFEAYHEKDNKLVKTAMLYFILTGVYWMSPPVGALWLLIHPKSLLGSAFAGKNNYEVGRMGGAGMLRHLESLDSKAILKLRLEVLVMIGIQVSLFLFLDLTFIGWIICYAGFALQWSGLQYADHAYSPRDIREGAWNLKVSKLTQYFYLNYHHHLAHHQHPHVPWVHLGKFVDYNKERPSFWEIYLRMWKGLVKIDPESPAPLDDNLEELINSHGFKN